MLNHIEIQILQQARNLIANPIRWTQKADARNNDGIGVYPYSKDAVCWCATGAIRKYARELGGNASDLIYKLNVFADKRLVRINDDEGHDKVLEIFDEYLKSIIRNTMLGNKELEIRVLRKTRSLIADPCCWTQGTRARDIDNIPVSPHDQQATRWCLSGAIIKYLVADGYWEFSEFPFFEEIIRRFDTFTFKNYDMSCVKFNDSVEHSKLIKMLDEYLNSICK